MPPSLTFVPPTPLPLRAAPRQRWQQFPQSCAQRPRPTPRPRPTRRPAAPPLPALAGAVAGALSLVFLPFSPARAAQSAPKPAPPAKQLRYDGRQELDSGEKAMSLTLTAGTFAALGVWAWKQNRRDDELENIRIKDEVERLEKLKAEFMDVEEDEESLDDEDLLASLKQRIGDTEEDDPDAEGGPKETVAERPDDSPKVDDEEGKQPDEQGADVATSDSLDMLKRMWDATDDDQQKKDNKS